MVTSDFRLEVEIEPCAMHPAIIIGTVRSLIVDVAIGQIPCSTERISSFKLFLLSTIYPARKLLHTASRLCTLKNM